MWAIAIAVAFFLLCLIQFLFSVCSLRCSIRFTDSFSTIEREREREKYHYYNFSQRQSTIEKHKRKTKYDEQQHKTQLFHLAKEKLK